jgi:hypothetical protein
MSYNKSLFKLMSKKVQEGFNFGGKKKVLIIKGPSLTKLLAELTVRE